MKRTSFFPLAFKGTALALLFISSILLGTPGLASAQPLSAKVHVSKAVKHDKTAPIRDLQWQLPEVVQRILQKHPMSPKERAQLEQKLARSGQLPSTAPHQAFPVRRKPPARKVPLTVHDKVRQEQVPSRSTSRGLAQAAPKITSVANFDGIANQWYIYPPDPNLAVGENYVVELVNSGFSVYDKSGNLVLGPVDTNTLWLDFGGPCENDNNGDGVVLYDQMAHRWIISQFAVRQTPYYECVAVSATGDPTGVYYRYAFKISNTLFPDYPKLGVWPNGYYATFNDFGNNGYTGVTVAAFDRQAMLSGKDATVVKFFLQVNPAQGDDYYSFLPADLDGNTLPPAGEPEKFLSYVSPNSWGTSNYALELWEMNVNWQTPSNSSFSGPKQITVPAFNDGVCYFSRNCIPQPNSAPGLDAISDRLMFRLAYHNLGTHEAMVVNQTVSVGSNNNPPAGSRWYELDTSSPGANDWSLKQSGTWAPADGNSRWMGSIAMDHHGDMFLGYSLSSSTVPPSIAFTGRVAGDPAGQMTVPEQTLVTGKGEQLGSASRWGDYTSAVVDPSNDCTFWYVNEYYQSTSQVGWYTRIGATQFSACQGITTGTLTGTVTSSANGSAVADALVVIKPGDIVTAADSSGKYQVKLDPGTYTVTARGYPYVTSSGTQVTVSASQSTSQDFTLQPEPMVTVSGNVTDGGNANGAHGWGLYAHLAATVPPFGQVAQAYTDPVTGAYSFKVAKGFTYAVKVAATNGAYNNSYDPASKTLAPTQSTTANFPLSVNAACGAPGYARSYGASFDGSTFPPMGWTVTNGVSGSPVVWQANTAWGEGNYTGGAGKAAAADSNLAYPYMGTYDTSLVTPPINVSDLGSDLTLHFLLNYQQYQSSALDVDISLDGAKTWTTVQHITSNQGTIYGLPGASDQIDLAKYIPTGTKTFELRWRYYDLGAGFDWYAQVDSIGIGECVPVKGGLVVGKVTDAKTGAGAIGQLVVDDLGDAALTYKTKSYANLKDLYVLFTQAGERTLTAVASATSFVSATANVSDDKSVRRDMALGNADLEIASLKGENITQGQLGDVATVKVTNNGPVTASHVKLTTSVSSFLHVEPGSTTTQGSCQIDFRTNGVDCALGDIAPGDSVTATIGAFGSYSGQATINASASEIDNDPNPQNNTAIAKMQILAPPSNSGGNNGGNSGGGSFGGFALFGLLSLALLAGWSRRRRSQ